MKEKVAQLFESLKANAGAMLQGAGQAIGPDVSRLATQGSMELASALFNGQAYVPYGPGQYTPDVDRNQQQTKQNQIERGGMER